jgi:hypothetical protein
LGEGQGNFIFHFHISQFTPTTTVTFSDLSFCDELAPTEELFTTLANGIKPRPWLETTANRKGAGVGPRKSSIRAYLSTRQSLPSHDPPPEKRMQKWKEIALTVSHGAVKRKQNHKGTLTRAGDTEKETPRKIAPHAAASNKASRTQPITSPTGTEPIKGGGDQEAEGRRSSRGSPGEGGRATGAWTGWPAAAGSRTATAGICFGTGGARRLRRHYVCGSLWQEVLLHLRRRAPPAVPSLSSLFPSSPGGQEGPPLPAPTPGGAPSPAPRPFPRYGSPGQPSVIISPFLFHFLVGRMARCGLVSMV